MDYVHRGVGLKVTNFAVQLGDVMGSWGGNNLRSFGLADGHEEVRCVLHLVLVKYVVFRGNSIPVQQIVSSDT